MCVCVCVCVLCHKCVCVLESEQYFFWIYSGYTKKKERRGVVTNTMNDSLGMRQQQFIGRQSTNTTDYMFALN